jgi:hypothetical protein
MVLAAVVVLGLAGTAFGVEKEAPSIAGRYFYGDGLGVNCSLKLSSSGSFDFKWRGCLGLYDSNYGGYVIQDGLVILKPKRLNIGKGFRGTPTKFLPVVWGERHYLVPVDKALDFVNEINQGSEPRKNRLAGGMFYLRLGDEERAVQGIPGLPTKWLDYLLPEPVRGKIIKMAGRRIAIVDIGRKQGLKVGMTLIARSPKDNMFAMLDVISVEDGQARAKVRYADDKVAAGDGVSTRFIE